MATIVLGCDKNNSNDKSCQNTVAKVLEKAGNTVEKLAIGPNDFASYSYSKKAKGKIGVFLIASGITAIADLYDGNTNFKYAYFGIRGDLKQARLSTMKEFNSSPISKDKHGDCISRSCNRLNGKTYPQMNEITKSKCIAVFGTTCKELGDNIVKAMGGDTSSSNSKSKSSSGSTIKEALKKAVSKWDGEVEINLRGDTVYVNKIKNPSDSKLVLNEYDNILYDSITVTDVNPGTINTLKMNFKDYELKLTDDTLIKRFGVIKKTITPQTSIKTLADAKAYLNREWNKLRRNNGRQVELKVSGNLKWKTGKWARVYIPSSYIDDYMYISKASHEEDGTSNGVTSLTLVDYPPSFGAYNETKTKNNTS